MEPRRPGKAEQIAALASALLMAWYMMPPQERQIAKLRVLQFAHRLASRLARAEGHRGMGDELAGREYFRYAVALRLGQARDKLAKALEDARP